MPSALPTFSFDQAAFLDTGELFPRDVWSDPWVAYHGTSSSRSLAIESNGLEWPHNLITREHVEKVVEIFRVMNWSGVSHGGLPVLEPFSLQCDFGACAAKPIYLAEVSFRAFTFAMKDFAGGETARAMRYSLDDLHHYLESSEIRQEHALGRGRRFDLPNTVKGPVDMEWLRAELAALALVHQLCKKFHEEHESGVVYAVRLDDDDLESLDLRGSMGIRAFRKIEPDKIVAKVLIPADAKKPFILPDNVRKRHFARLQNPDCLLGRLKKRGARP